MHPPMPPNSICAVTKLPRCIEDLSVFISRPSQVPEPSSLILLSVGLMLMGLIMILPGRQKRCGDRSGLLSP